MALVRPGHTPIRSPTSPPLDESEREVVGRLNGHDAEAACATRIGPGGEVTVVSIDWPA
jgi:hypothetical protein